MKTPLLVLAALGSTLTAAQAQTTIGKGTGLLTGSVGFHTETDDLTSNGNGGLNSKNTYRTFRLDFAVGGFVADNLALGVQLQHTVTGGSYSSSSSNNQSGPPTSSTLRVGPMAQYYQMFSEQFGMTATLGAGYESDSQWAQRTSSYPPYYYYSNLKVSGYYVALTPGIVFFPVPKFGLTASIGSLSYNRLKVKDTGSADRYLSALDAGFGLSQLQFGANYYFGRK
ncbi:hypothetical protein GCM10028824_41090 [Hymenobacter segetis]|uniref:Outer membrane protein beta-barrel domain-containing protein n=1 Tax=Hymenobacter segetis TaxID=2025509 RepID=A0ABU9LYX5_9BACT